MQPQTLVTDDVGQKPTLNKKDSSLIILDGFDLKIRNLVTYTPETKTQKPKVILKGINTHIKAGHMTAIIGSSGAGKTTFLNFLSGRQDESQQFLNNFEYYVNNTRIDDISTYKNLVGYVMQEDLMDGRMNIEQTLEYYYSLRMDADVPYSKRMENKNAVIDDLIQLLGLQKSRKTVIGDEMT